MKAIVLNNFGGPEVLVPQEIPQPVIDSQEILINIYATALNRADLLERQGLYPPPGKTPMYQIPGLECSGVVEQIGPKVTKFKVGDRVMALLDGGGYAQKVACHELMAWKIPEGMGYEEAAGIPEVFLTAYDALIQKAELSLGDSVIIHAGAGGVGSAGIQLAVVGGMPVLATVGSQKKASFVSQLGADVVVNYRESSFSSTALEWTEGIGVRAVLDFVGKNYLSDNIRSLKPGGFLVVIGTLSGSEVSINLGKLLAKRLTLRGTALRSRPIFEKMQLVKLFEDRIMPKFSLGTIKPIIDKVFPFSEVSLSHKYMATNQNIGKIILSL